MRPATLKDLFDVRGFSQETINHARLDELPPSQIKKLGFQFGDLKSDAILIPYLGLDGKPLQDDLGNHAARIRLLEPPKDGPKYLSRTGAGIQTYIPPGITLNGDGLLVITEGEFKALAGVQAGIPTVAIQGCNCWHDSKRWHTYVEHCEKHWLPQESISMRTPIEHTLLSLITRPDGTTRTILVLGDADLNWKTSASGARESLYTLRSAVAFQTGAKVTVTFCPPVCEKAWLEENRAIILTTIKGKVTEKRLAQAEQCIDDALTDKRGALRQLADIFKKHAPSLYDGLKAHKTGLDDWILYEKKKGAANNGSALQAIKQHLRKHIFNASEAVFVEYRPGRADITLPLIKESVGSAKNMNICLLNDEVHCFIEQGRKGDIPKIRPLENPALLMEELARRVRLYRQDPKSGYQEMDLPQKYLEILAQSREYRTTDGAEFLYRPLKGIQTLPVMADDGSIRAFKDGYHDEYIWHIPHLEAIIRAIPANPTPEDVRKAVNLLFEPFRETPFADIESVSTFFELLLTVATRRGTLTAPAFLISSPSAGTGKTYLARMAAYLVSGEMPDTLPWPTQRGAADEEELRKLLMTLLLAKPSAILFDNIPSGLALASSTLDMIITAPSWKGRLLGGNKYVSMATDTTLIFTGNNISLTGDTTSRFQFIRLNAEMEDAHTRAYRRGQSEWMRWIDEHRPALIAAILTIQRAFILSNKSREIAASLSKQSRFQEWQPKARLPIVWMGSLGIEPTGQPFVDPETSTTAHNIDPSFEIEARVVHSLHTVFGSGLFSARDIALIARKDSPSDTEVDLLDAFGIDDRRGGHGVVVKVGTRLTRLIDKWYRGLSIRKDKDKIDAHTHTMKYYVVTKGDGSGPQGPSGGPDSPKPEDDFSTEPATPITAAEQAAEGCTDTIEVLEDQEEAATDTAPKPLQETLEIPDDIPDDVLDDISEPLPEIAPETRTTPFLTALIDEHRELLRGSPWCSFDLETTALSRASAPCILTNLTQIGGTPWKKYQDTHSPKVDTAPRARILSGTVHNGEGPQTLAWDLDRLSDADKAELFTLAIHGKTLIGHNLSFDLSWAAWYTDAQPARVLDTMLLIRALWPDLPLTLHENPNTEAAEKLITASKPGGLAGIGLEAVAAALGIPLPQGKAYQKPENWVPATLTTGHYEYAVSDTTIALEVLRRILEHLGLPDDPANAWDTLEAKNPRGWQAYREAFAPAVPLLAQMHRLGLPLDTEGLDALMAVKDREAQDCAEELIQLIPGLEPFRDDLIRGGLPDGAKRAIYDHVMSHGINVGMTPKSGMPAISDRSIKKSGADKLPFFKPWEGLREAVKIRQMLESLKSLSTVDGRLHSLISIAAATGRTTSQEPNAQNFPRDPAFRALVRASEGHVLVDADLGAIEMRIAAALAERAIREYRPGGPRSMNLPKWILGEEATRSEWQDGKVAEWHAAKKMMESVGWKARLSAVFREGIDPHVATGLALMRAAGEAPSDMPEDIIRWLSAMSKEERGAMKKVVGEWRQKAKALNFGLLYGQSGRGLHEYGLTVYGLSWTPEEAEEARRIWLDTYPEIRFWQIATELGGARLTVITTRDRYSGKLECKDRRVFRATTLSGRPLCTLTVQSILNYGDQGSGAEMLLMAMARLPEDLRPCIVDIIHDEVLLEIPADKADYAREALERAMIEAAEALLAPWSITAEADAATGTTWAEAKK